MRTFFIIFLCVYMTACTRKNGPVAYCKPNIIDIGSIPLNKAYKGFFSVKNIGDDALKIDKITSDCECTVIKGYEDTALPGQSVKIAYNLTPHLAGYCQQNIFITNNSVKEKVLMVTIRAKVEF